MPEIAVSLSDLLRSSTGAAPAKLPLPEAQVATLLEVFQRYTSPCPFRPGDVVTPRSGFGYTDEGRPHVVLEVLDSPMVPTQVTDRVTPASNLFGLRLDVRVCCFRSNGEIDAFWQESWRMQRWEHL